MRNDVVTVLNGLIETCHDGENGFLEAVELTREPSLRSLFAEFAEQRRQFAVQLQYEVSKRGGRPEQSGSLLGKVHRRWIDVKSAFTGGGMAAIMTECGRGEEMAIRAYRKALAADVSEDVHLLVEEQYAQIQRVRDRIYNLESRLVDELSA